MVEYFYMFKLQLKESDRHLAHIYFVVEKVLPSARVLKSVKLYTFSVCLGFASEVLLLLRKLKTAHVKLR